MSANAHETRDSISLISYVGCLGIAPVISAKIHSKGASKPEIKKKTLTKTPILRFKVVKVIDVGTTGKVVSSACYDNQQPFSR